VIDNVLAYLRQNPEVTTLIDAQIARLLPVLGAHPAVRQLVHDQVTAILPDLVNDPTVQALIRAQAGQYIAYLQTAPDTVQPLIRQQGDIYIDYLNDHPAPVQTLVQGQSLSLGRPVARRGARAHGDRRLVSRLDRARDSAPQAARGVIAAA
jgi:hypothetical protein